MKIKKPYKIILVVLAIITLVIVGQLFYERYLLQHEYAKILRREMDEYISSFYQSNFCGVITYIKQYEKNPDNYVIGITDSAMNERTIGKVEITNFEDVKEGDTIRKKSNSFELEISGQQGKILSLVKY